MNPKRGVQDVEVDLRIGWDGPDRANRYASEQESRRCLDPMRSIYDRCGKDQRTTLHEVPATTRHGLDLGCEIALERRRDNLERSWTAVRRPTPGS
jgi:uroporphyrinogen-III decarboxylase